MGCRVLDLVSGLGCGRACCVLGLGFGIWGKWSINLESMWRIEGEIARAPGLYKCCIGIARKIK